MVSSVWTGLKVVGLPAFHLARLCFGLSLLFYGMAFRTFAFHVIVFRIAGLKQVGAARFGWPISELADSICAFLVWCDVM